MKKRIFVPIEIELEIDTKELGGTIKNMKVHKKTLTKKEVEKLFEEAND